jgi:threonine/homoserine/homoserine lactone efflux protein
MHTILFIKGIIAGLSMAIPVGPIGILCIRRTLLEGRLSGFVSALGLATADVVFGCIAGFGITFVSDFIIEQQIWIRLFGGLFLCFLGLRISSTKYVECEIPSRGKGLLGAFTSMFLLTMTYPMTILIFLGIFAGLRIENAKGNFLSIIALILGVFIGSILWWFILNMVIGSLRKKINTQGWQWVNKVSGTLVTGFGLVVLLSLIF